MRALSRLVALLAVGACGGTSTSTSNADASYFGPPPEAGDASDCKPGFFGGDPTTQCIARWDCTTEGTLTLLCGTNVSPPNPACLCARDGATPMVVGTPATCMDVAVLRQFAITNCGWSFL